MVHRLGLVGLLVVVLAAPATSMICPNCETQPYSGATTEDGSATSTPSPGPPTKAEAMKALRDFLGVDSGNVTLFAFDGTVLEMRALASHRESIRRMVVPLHLHRGAVLKYAAAPTWKAFATEGDGQDQDAVLAPRGIVQIEGMIEGTLSDHEGPHLLTANLHDLELQVTWQPADKRYEICMAGAGYIQDVMADENYVRWGQDVEALLAGASVTRLGSHLYHLTERVPGWTYCPELSTDTNRKRWRPNF